MRLKLLRAPTAGAKDMVCQTDKKTYDVKVGDTLEVPDQEGHAIMQKWGHCFEVAKAAAPAPEEKSVQPQGYENKKASPKKDY